MFISVPFGEIIERPPHEQEEVKEKALISTKILPRSLSTESQSDWIEPVMHLYSSKNCQSQEREKVLDAFRLLQMNPSIQVMQLKPPLNIFGKYWFILFLGASSF